MKELSERQNERASSPNDRFLQHTALSLHVSQYGKCQVCKCLIQVMYVFINIDEYEYIQNIYSHTHIRTTYIHTRIHIFAHACIHLSISEPIRYISHRRQANVHGQDLVLFERPMSVSSAIQVFPNCTQHTQCEQGKLVTSRPRY